MNIRQSVKPIQRTTLVIAIAGALAFLTSGTIFAQDIQPSAQPTQPDQVKPKDATTLDVINVTATKRVQNIRKIPVAINVVSEEQLDNLHATQFTDYAAYIPGLQFTSTGAAGKTSIALRGIAPISSGTTVGTYIDETQLGSSGLYQAATNFQLDLLPYDISRVEVLRGPQGTLYGAGSMGGLVKYVTRDPDLSHTEFRVGGGVSDVASSGNTGWDAHFGANLPLAKDTVGLRVSYARNEIPGFIDNAANGRKDINGGTQDSARVALLWQPNADVSLRLTALGQKIDSDNDALVALDPVTQRPRFGDLTNKVLVNEPFAKELGLLAATLDWNLGWADFTSATGYSNTSTSQRSDTSTQYGAFTLVIGLPAPGTSGFDLGLSLHKFSQEFRLTSKPGTPFLWQVGAYYTKESADQTQVLTLGQPDGTPLPAPFDAFNTLAALALPSTYKEKALFGNASYQFGDRFTLGGGVRYSRNDQVFAQQVTGGVLIPLGSTPGSSHENNFTWSISPQFELSKDARLYARVATGYQPGGPNVALPGVPPQVDSSTLTSYELGLKSELADHRVVFDVAVFNIDWKNIQVGAVTAGGIGYLANGGKATSRGVELSTVFKPTDNLRLGLVGTYTDATLSNGNQLPFIPKFAASATVDYFIPLHGGWTARLGGGYRWVGSRESDTANNSFSHLDSYGALDLNADLSNEHWTIRGYLKNATDERAYLNKTAINNLVLGGTDRIAAVPIQPRTFGFEVDYRF